MEGFTRGVVQNWLNKLGCIKAIVYLGICKLVGFTKGLFIFVVVSLRVIMIVLFKMVVLLNNYKPGGCKNGLVWFLKKLCKRGVVETRALQ